MHPIILWMPVTRELNGTSQLLVYLTLTLKPQERGHLKTDPLFHERYELVKVTSFKMMKVKHGTADA
jgi:hypothetical protein